MGERKKPGIFDGSILVDQIQFLLAEVCKPAIGHTIDYNGIDVNPAYEPHEVSTKLMHINSVIGLGLEDGQVIDDEVMSLCAIYTHSLAERYPNQKNHIIQALMNDEFNPELEVPYALLSIPKDIREKMIEALNEDHS